MSRETCDAVVNNEGGGAARVLVAGAAGVIGAALIPILRGRGFDVTGTTRSTERVARLRAAGATPLVVDAFDRSALIEGVADARPDVVIHLLTDLATPAGQPISDEELIRTARLRDEGTANLVAAAEAAGARWLIAASLAGLYAAAEGPHSETDPLLEPSPGGSPTVQGVLDLERRTADAAVPSIVLRYGWLYGPGTGWVDLPPPPAVHVDAAAWAAALAVDRGAPGTYNVTDDDGPVASHKARESFGWSPSMRRPAVLIGEER